MIIYFFLFSIIFFLMLAANEKNKFYKKIAFIIMSVIIILIIGMRNIKLGISDTEHVYIPEFRRLQSMDFSEILVKFKDPFFYLISKAISLFTNNETIWLIICASLYIIPVMYIIYRESKYPLLSLAMFFSLNYFGMGFYGIRHCIALGIVFLSFYSLRDKNLKKFIITIVCASLFHISALIFLISYPIVHYFNYKSRRTFVITCVGILIMFIISNVFGKNIISNLLLFAVENLKLTRFSIYTQENFSSLNNNIFYINYIIYVFAGWYACSLKKLKSEENSKVQILVKNQLIGCVISSFMGVLGESYRLSMFFTIFSILLLPEAIKEIKSENKKIIFWGLFIIFIAYFFVASGENNNIIPYYFYWE